MGPGTPTPPVRPIVFTVDDRYVRPLAVALESLASCATRPREVIVAHERLHPLHRWLLARRHRHTHLSLRFVRLRLPTLRWKPVHHFSRAILLRLLLAGVIEAPSFIYIDADVLFVGDPSALDGIALEGAPLAAVPWSCPRDLGGSGHGILARYFASSLLVIDRARFNAHRIADCCLALIERHRFDFPDQDALNLCCPSWQELPRGLCHEIPDIGPPLSGHPAAALMLQFSGSEKPWHPFSRHPCRQLFTQWLRRTPYRGFPPGPSDLRWRSLVSRLRQRLRSPLRSRSSSTSR